MSNNFFVFFVFYNRETIMKYVEAVHELSMRIGKTLAESLGVKSANMGIEKWPCQFRINKYHFTPESVGSPGVQIHTDSGFLTILQDDEGVGGLEVMNKSGEFIPVEPWPDTLLVNLGDTAKVWSNGRFCNVKHRVQCKEAKIRVSIASFLLFPSETVLEPPLELVDDDHPRRYVPFMYQDYRKLRLSTKLEAGEALALLHTPISHKFKLKSVVHVASFTNQYRFKGSYMGIYIIYGENNRFSGVEAVEEPAAATLFSGNMFTFSSSATSQMYCIDVMRSTLFPSERR
ncbi:putative flavanone 3-dioxygenase [Helianthus annuus]|nr:putative flavanone 3-dioxygenase [Helianthus annuus]